MKYIVKSPDGHELTCPSIWNLVALYNQGFIGDEDFIRAENAERWVRASAMPALHGVREVKRDPRKVMYIFIAALCLTLGIVLLLRNAL